MKNKKICIIGMLIIVTMLIIPTNVRAGLQANGNEPTTKNRDTWMSEVRKMESLGGTLGLNETQNADLTSNSGSNKIDIHLQKNTEYGAVALLSASSYGNPVKIENGETTTGNSTGIVFPDRTEWVAGQFTNWLGTTGYANRYINYYATDNNVKVGDAMIETQGWHGTGFFYAYGQHSDEGQFRDDCYRCDGIVRNYNHGIFSYSNRGYTLWPRMNIYSKTHERSSWYCLLCPCCCYQWRKHIEEHIRK